jgi:hypothetical protein
MLRTETNVMFLCYLKKLRKLQWKLQEMQETSRKSIHSSLEVYIESSVDLFS